jgi:hypothetical protein
LYPAKHLLLGVLRQWTRGELPPAFALGAAATSLLLVLFYVGFRESGVIGIGEEAAETTPEPQLSSTPKDY